MEFSWNFIKILTILRNHWFPLGKSMVLGHPSRPRIGPKPVKVGPKSAQGAPPGGDNHWNSLGKTNIRDFWRNLSDFGPILSDSGPILVPHGLPLEAPNSIYILIGRPPYFQWKISWNFHENSWNFMKISWIFTILAAPGAPETVHFAVFSAPRPEMDEISWKIMKFYQNSNDFLWNHWNSLGIWRIPGPPGSAMCASKSSKKPLY